ncbi:hypothetical protein BCPG_03377 [Burkholderia cenocepacia PC184]|nr:hypothetical protein BCPG_03377 [Burkholderia cenocepacia PC184]
MGRMGRHRRADDEPPLRRRNGADVRAVASAGQAAAGAGAHCRRRAGDDDRARSRIRQRERVHRHVPARAGDDAGEIHGNGKPSAAIGAAMRMHEAARRKAGDRHGKTARRRINTCRRPASRRRRRSV